MDAPRSPWHASCEENFSRRKDTDAHLLSLNKIDLLEYTLSYTVSRRHHDIRMFSNKDMPTTPDNYNNKVAFAAILSFALVVSVIVILVHFTVSRRLKQYLCATRNRLNEESGSSNLPPSYGTLMLEDDRSIAEIEIGVEEGTYGEEEDYIRWPRV